jgi:hypothetical protein
MPFTTRPHHATGPQVIADVSLGGLFAFFDEFFEMLGASFS